MTQVQYCTGKQRGGTCEAPIWWLEHVTTGRTAPIDVEPDPEKGNIIVSLEDGQYRIATEGDPPAERHMNHFVTCPDRARFRKSAG